MCAETDSCYLGIIGWYNSKCLNLASTAVDSDLVSGCIM